MEKNIKNVQIASEFLYTALASLEELGLYNTTGYSGVEEKINNLVNNIGKYSEELLLINALEQKIRFIPRYLNNIEDYYKNGN